MHVRLTGRCMPPRERARQGGSFARHISGLCGRQISVVFREDFGFTPCGNAYLKRDALPRNLLLQPRHLCHQPTRLLNPLPFLLHSILIVRVRVPIFQKTHGETIRVYALRPLLNILCEKLKTIKRGERTHASLLLQHPPTRRATAHIILHFN